MKDHFALTDLSSGATSYSEASAESIFSVLCECYVWDKSLTMEGPKASTHLNFEIPIPKVSCS